MKEMKRREGAPVREWDGSPFRIIAFDPGQTTGWAYCEGRDYEFQWKVGQIGPDAHHLVLWSDLVELYGDFLEPIHPLIKVVYESFEFRQHINRGHEKTKVELISCEYIGVINLFCQVHNLVPTKHTASAAKTFIPDWKIKALGLWTPGMPHAMDATRHLLRHMVVGMGVRGSIIGSWLDATPG